MEHRHLHRTYLPDAIYLVTTNVRLRTPFFRHEHLAKLMEQSIWWRRKCQYVVYAYVVMPDHLHLLLQPMRGNISQILQSLKLHSSLEINRCLNKHSDESAFVAMGGYGMFRWQKGFYDHVITDDQDLINHVEYIRYNPVKAGLVEQPENYPFLFVDENAVRRMLV